jgi:predicted nucleic acid-binding protein
VIIVSDTSVITNLAAIGHIQILHQLYDRILIPEAVYQELTHIDPPVPGTLEAQTFTWIERRIVCDHQLVQQLQIQAKLDPGESEAIALALEIDADLLLIDERCGRAEANRKRIRIIGLLGVLLEAKQCSLISEVKPLMEALINTFEFRISQVLYNQILQLVGETEINQ